MGYIAGIGGANMDIHGKADNGIMMRDSNPGTLHASLGGVCRNICENLARLGGKVKLVTVVGDDANGKMIVKSCEEAGIDMSELQTMVSVMGGTLDDIFDGSDMRLPRPEVAALKAEIEALKEENTRLTAENGDLRTQITALDRENERLLLTLAHKEELLVLHAHYNGLRR
jgi:pseudouridine kinase